MRRLAAFLLAAAALGAQEIPDWVRQAAATAAPPYPPKVATVVLLAEEHVTVDAEGRHIMRERGAVRTLEKSSSSVVAYRSYNSKSGRIASFQGWLLPPSGKPVVFGKNAIVDRAAGQDYTYSESRYQSLDSGSGLEPGTVFAWQIVEEEKSVFTFSGYGFQGYSPVLVSRFILAMPPGWEVRGTVFNHAPVEPQVTGATYTWELRDLPWIEPEVYSPGISALAPRLGVNYFPSGESKPELRPLKDWSAVSAWLSGFADPSAEVTPAVRQKASELTAGAATELDKIRAIARFVQKTNYVEVLINVSRGGGFTPRPADDVLATNYGDCKDKAALARALFKAAGIESYVTVIQAASPEFVRPEWPAPQFDHAIIAIRVSPGTKLPAVLEHASLGRLLFFDPTSQVTSLGDIPQGEQGSHALVLAGARGELVTVPLLAPALGRIESRVEAKLELSGRLSARISRDCFGQSALYYRGVLLHDNQDELKKAFEEALSERLGGLTVDRIEPSDRAEENLLQLKLDFSVKQFGRLLQNRLLLVAPGTLGLGAGYEFPAKPRKLPVKLTARARKDSVEITVPPEFKVDELPDPVTLDGPYGTFTAQWKVEGERILFEHSLEVRDTLVPAADYAKVRRFFEDIAAAQTSAVVLLKQ